MGLTGNSHDPWTVLVYEFYCVSCWGTLMIHLELWFEISLFECMRINCVACDWETCSCFLDTVCMEMSNFPSPWEGPHFPVLCPMLGWGDLSPPPFLKEQTPVPEVVWKCQIFFAHDMDLTFPSWVQSLGRSICPHTHLPKNEDRPRSLSRNVEFS